MRLIRILGIVSGIFLASVINAQGENSNRQTDDNLKKFLSLSNIVFVGEVVEVKFPLHFCFFKKVYHPDLFLLIYQLLFPPLLLP